MFSIKKWKNGNRWRNWSGSYSADPSAFYAPKSVEELISIVKHHHETGKKIRVTGAAHSFSPVALPEQTALSLHYLRGLMHVDYERMEATFYAGTYLYEIGPLLAAHGLAVYNMGDIDMQSLAGVVGTGTHGTGITLGSFSNTIVKWCMINGLGQYVEYERTDDATSKALHLSLGLLGIFVALTMKVRPLYSLHYISERVDFETMLTTFDAVIHAHRHVEWYYFPGSTTLQKKTMDEVPVVKQRKWQAAVDYAQLQIVENGLLYMASELCKWKPSLSRHVSELSSKLITTGQKTSVCYEIFPTPRHVKFHEVEYAIPLEAFPSCMEAIHQLFTAQTLDVHFPIECRVAAAEEGYLSPTQGKQVAYIAFHQYKAQNPEQYFRRVDELMQNFHGRAHWGKLNRYAAQKMEVLYPQLASFENVRQLYDPTDVFMTATVRKILHNNDNS